MNTEDGDREKDNASDSTPARGEAASDALETLAEGRHLALRRRGHWEFAERCGSKGVVAVVALTDDQQMILVEQTRTPVENRVIELPAGLAGDIPYQEDEPLASAANRELFEETGYRAKEMRHLVSGPSSAGLSNEVVTFFHARGLTKMGEGGGTHDENIRVHHVPRREVREWCAEQIAAGKMVDFKVYAALYLVSADTFTDSVKPRLWH